MMKIRMSRAYAAYKKGEVVELPEQQAESLIAWEYATRASDADQPLLDMPKRKRRVQDDPRVERAQSEPDAEWRAK
ncbi:MAG: hypothetical protein EBR82_50940 [Caulobacteraceae bacterium]|nr:hypothetical protein [Caulobacteraceae bacterium]